jgi:hypothetical protein
MSDSPKPIQFSLTGIKTVQFATIEQEYQKGKEVKVESGLDFALNHENKSLVVIYKGNFLCEGKPFIILAVGCEFKIDPKAFKEFLDVDKKQFIVPKGFITHLAFLTVGTSRGILHSKLEGSKFSQFILPTVDLTKMIKEDIVFEKDQVKKTKEKKI